MLHARTRTHTQFHLNHTVIGRIRGKYVRNFEKSMDLSYAWEELTYKCFCITLLFANLRQTQPKCLTSIPTSMFKRPTFHRLTFLIPSACTSPSLPLREGRAGIFRKYSQR